jgi:hypothetical protein
LKHFLQELGKSGSWAFLNQRRFSEGNWVVVLAASMIQPRGLYAGAKNTRSVIWKDSIEFDREALKPLIEAANK